jgi:hypothetical protein
MTATDKIRALADAEPWLANHEIAARLGVDRRRVHEALAARCACGARMNIRAERCRECFERIEALAVAARLDDVAALYNEGASQREIAAYLGYGPTSIPPELDLARKRGLLIGARHALQGDGIVEIRDSIVEGCLADGWPREDIAAAVGLAPKSIHTVLKRLRARSA